MERAVLIRQSEAIRPSQLHTDPASHEQHRLDPVAADPSTSSLPAPAEVEGARIHPVQVLTDDTRNGLAKMKVDAIIDNLADDFRV